RAMAPVVEAEQATDPDSGLLRVIDRRRNLDRRARVARRSGRPAEKLLAARDRPMPGTIAILPSEQRWIACRDGAAARVGAEEVEIAAVALQGYQEARDPLVKISNHDLAHDVLLGPGTDVARLVRERPGNAVGRVACDLRELAPDGGFESMARPVNG